jgi:hypothetical protein
MSPWLAPDGVTVFWTCGNLAGIPTVNGTAATLLASAGSSGGTPNSTVPVQYLPKSCHS